MKHALVVTAMVLGSACGGDKPAVTGETTGDSSGGTLGMSSTPTSGDAPVDSSSTASGETSTGPNTTSTSTTTSDESTSDEPEPDSLCGLLCSRGPECGLRPGGEPCLLDCLEGEAALTGACADAAVDSMQCLIDLPCAQWVPFVELGDPGPCQGIVDQQTFVCSLGGCDPGGGIDDDDTCSLTLQCEGEPLKRMECDQGMCTCHVGDQQIGTCDAGDACIDVQHTAAWAQVCCAF